MKISFMIAIIVGLYGSTSYSQVLFNDGKLMVRASKQILKSSSCNNRTFSLGHVDIVLQNLTSDIIRIDNMSFTIPAEVTGTGIGDNGVFNPCEIGDQAQNGAHVTGGADGKFIIQPFSHGTTRLGAWLNTSEYNIQHNLRYTIIPSKTNNSSSNQEQLNQKVTPTSTSTIAKGRETKYYIENGQLVIDNFDHRELILISKMTYSEIKYYENLSGLKLSYGTDTKPGNNSVINKNENENASQNKSKIDLEETSSAQQRKEKDYEIFKQQQQEKQQREFNDHIQRQAARVESFNKSLDLAGNLLLSALNAGRNNRANFAVNFVSGYLSNINSIKSSINYYNLSNNSKSINYDLNEKYLVNKELLVDNRYVQNTYEGTAIKLLVNHLKSGSSDMRYICVRIINPNYNGQINIIYGNTFLLKPYDYQYLSLNQRTQIDFYRPNGYIDNDAFLAITRSLAEYPFSNKLFYSIFDIVDFENVTEKIENLPDGSTVRYPNSWDKIKNSKAEPLKFYDGTFSSDLYNIIKVQLSTGELFYLTTQDNANSFINKAYSLLELAKKEYYLEKYFSGNTTTQSITQPVVKTNPVYVAPVTAALDYGYGTSDARTVNVGTQEWLGKNLNVDRFANGNIITHAQTKEEWKSAWKQKQPAWCYYEIFGEYKPEYGETIGRKYGKLYNWYAVTDPRGLCPIGWHVPNDSEWDALINHLGGPETAGAKLKSTTGWVSGGGGNNISGLAFLPGMDRDADGTFYPHIQTGSWWSSSAGSLSYALFRILWKDKSKVGRGENSKGYGYSVRCVKD
jgi:uncharacterized protein (TIGR02145 family)